MKIEVSNVLTVIAPTQEMIDWCNKNLVISNGSGTHRAS